jgi:hypothetical protein
MTDLREKLLKAGLVSQEQAQAAATAEAEKTRQKQQARAGRPDGRPEGRDNRGGDNRGGDNRGGDNRGGERRDNRGGDRGRGGNDRPPRNERPQDNRPRDNDGKRLSGDEVKRLVELAQKGKVEPKTRGHRRWYFESRKQGLVPFLEISDDTAQQLEGGTWRICETPRGEVWLIDADTARELGATDPAWVR